MARPRPPRLLTTRSFFNRYPAPPFLCDGNDARAGQGEDYSIGLSLALARGSHGMLGGIWGWLGAYRSAGGRASLVARNLTLDGSPFRDSLNADRKPFFAAGEWGVSVRRHPVPAVFSHVPGGKELEGPGRNSQFAAVAATVYF